MRANKDLSQMLDNLVEKKYTLRLEHNHGTMQWFAYYAGKFGRNLFDEEDDWLTAGATPEEAVAKLTDLLATDSKPTRSNLEAQL